MCGGAASVLHALHLDDLTRIYGWTHPRLVEELHRFDALAGDRVELFGRMVFNGARGNDDNHMPITPSAIVPMSGAGIWRRPSMSFPIR